MATPYVLSYWVVYILLKQFLRIKVLYPHLGKYPHSPLSCRRPTINSPKSL